jgi:hypothetical protein
MPSSKPLKIQECHLQCVTSRVLCFDWLLWL